MIKNTSQNVAFFFSWRLSEDLTALGDIVKFEM